MLCAGLQSNLNFKISLEDNVDKNLFLVDENYYYFA